MTYSGCCVDRCKVKDSCNLCDTAAVLRLVGYPLPVYLVSVSSLLDALARSEVVRFVLSFVTLLGPRF